jgi:SAM-dependent methyltransferase
MPKSIPASEPRSRDELREHYEVERELAHRLRSASRDERLQLYSSIYDELFRRVPGHPQLTWKTEPQAHAWAVDRQLRLLRPLFAPTTTFMEIGAGDCALSRAASPLVEKAYAVDVSAEITRNLDLPVNVEVVISDGSSVPVPAGSVDVAYSNNLMEHLHPEDAADQLRNVERALRPGGVYVCLTPNRLGGPHDISQYFSDVATGFHLKEYTLRELRALFASVGFDRIGVYVGGRGWYRRSPYLPIAAIEAIVERLPAGARRRVANSLPVGSVLGIRIVGRKPAAAVEPSG